MKPHAGPFHTCHTLIVSHRMLEFEVAFLWVLVCSILFACFVSMFLCFGLFISLVEPSLNLPIKEQPRK